MAIRKFKTTINCGGCLAKVAPFLNNEKTIDKWEVDVSSPEKILTVETAHADTEKIIAAVEKAGFRIEPIKNTE